MNQTTDTTDTKKTAKRALNRLKPRIRGNGEKAPDQHDVQPVDELRRLVREHQALNKAIVATLNRSRDKKLRDGTIVKCLLSNHAKETLINTAKELGSDRTKYERAMKEQLKKVPLYEVLLKNVHGCGIVTAAYLCALLDPVRGVKTSNVVRYCGLAIDPDTGRLERLVAGKVRKYNPTMRTVLFCMFSSLWRVSARDKVTSKYLDIWRGKVRSYEHHADGPRKGGHKAGWHTAARVFLEDVYLVLRSLNGLPVWPSFNASKLGYSHGGKTCVNEPRMLTVEEALETVGFVGKTATTAPVSGEVPMDVTDLDIGEEEFAAE
jgi:hypothetical protein